MLKKNMKSLTIFADSKEQISFSTRPPGGPLAGPKVKPWGALVTLL